MLHHFTRRELKLLGGESHFLARTTSGLKISILVKAILTIYNSLLTRVVSDFTYLQMMLSSLFLSLHQRII